MEQADGHDLVRPTVFSTSPTRIVKLLKIKKEKKECHCYKRIRQKFP